MRAVVIDQYGGPDVLRVAEVPQPVAGPGQVRVRVRTAGVNPVDAKQRGGYFSAVAPATFPLRLGNEYAGVVDQLGDGVQGFAAGDEVFGSATGQCYADWIIAEAADTVVKPASMDWEAAGGLSAVGQTAYSALTRIGVTDGDTVLVHAAAGGVGTVAVQIARLWGATVIGTASEGNHDYLRSLGAVPVAYGPGLAERVRRVAPQGVDAALDLIGGADATAVSLDLVTDRDRIGTTIDTEAARTHGFHRVGGRTTPGLRQVAHWYEEGALTLPAVTVYALDQAATAHRHIETGHTRGKIVLRVS